MNPIYIVFGALIVIFAIVAYHNSAVESKEQEKLETANAAKPVVPASTPTTKKASVKKAAVKKAVKKGSKSKKA